ncbi:MAG: hypothetical protein JAZ11_11300 [Candidatus Thiodiazotropha lotti]|nr:hypothetical protein [Candidatus Thiodiazotropha lotti]
MVDDENNSNEALGEASLLATVEAALDSNYHRLTLPHPNRTLAIWYLLTVAEDYQRNLFCCLEEQISEAGIEFQIDRLKYSLRYGLDRIFKETSDLSKVQVPRRIVPMIYERTGCLLFGGMEFIAANQMCSAAHARTVRFIEHGDDIEVVIYERYHDKGYAALELMGHQEPDAIDFSGLLFAWMRFPEDHAPAAVEWIANTIRVRNRLVVYQYQQEHAIQLAQSIPQQSFLIPIEWQFPWGRRAETTLLLNALSLRCIYHLVAVHFGAARRGMRGGAEANICLVLTVEQLVEDLELMSSLSYETVTKFVRFLTYGHNTQTPDPSLQPLIPLGVGRIGIPCMHFLSSNQERNLLSLQARVQQTKFDALSDLFEKEMVARLEARLRTRWPLLSSNVNLTFDGVTEEVDLLIADPESCTLLVCELRWMLQPGDPREVQNRKRVCWQKVDQLERKVQWLQLHAFEAIRHVFNVSGDVGNTGSWNVVGVVVIENFGGTRSSKAKLPIMTSALFELGVLNATSLEQFGEWSQSLVWLPQEGLHFEVKPYETAILGRTLNSFAMERLQTRRDYREFVLSTIL